jgi:DNA ligase (NAD+)
MITHAQLPTTSMEALASKYRKDNSIIFQLKSDDLANLISHADDLYYNTKKQLMTDTAYDEAREQLRELAPDHPTLKKVRAPVKTEKKVVKLSYWMASLEKIKGESAVAGWITKHPGFVVIMEKLDGASGLLEKKNSKLSLFKNGDDTGSAEDISHLIPHLKIPKLDDIDEIAVRLEIIISKDNYDKFGIDPEIKNPRSISTGLINAKHPDPSLLPYLSIVAYEQIYPTTLIVDGLKNMKELGFDVVRSFKTKKNLTFSRFQQMLQTWREESNFAMDGLVLFHNVEYKIEWGKQYPSHAVAFKDPSQMEKKEVSVVDVQWRISKDGYLKPRVFYDPVRLNGDLCVKANAHNAKYVKDNGIGPGARILVMKSGDVIPYVCKVVSPSPNGPQFPPNYEWVIPINKNREINEIRAIGDQGRDEQLISLLVHFSTKMEIEGLKRGKVKRLVEGKAVTKLEDLWHLKKTTLAKLPGWKEKSIDNLLNSLTIMREKRDLARLMGATNLFGRGLSEKSLKLIVDNGIDASLTVEQLLEIKRIGEVKAKDFAKGLPKFLLFIKSIGLSLDDFKVNDYDVAEDSPLKDQVIVFTGVRPKPDARVKIEQLGGRITSAISGNTTIVVANLKRAGQKLEKAKNSGVIILSEEEFTEKYLK